MNPVDAGRHWCFLVNNFQAVQELDANALEHLEAVLTSMGVIPTDVDSERGVFCVSCVNTSVTVAQIEMAFRRFNFEVQLQDGYKHERMD